ncbi:MAG TPA: hypothetical protein VFD41_09765 [Actinomycetales bacterium]|nr:hypothetical protein [Actinomycetales bacterium]
MTGQRLDLPWLTSRWQKAVNVFVLAVPWVVGVPVFLTQPENRPFVVVFAPLFTAFMLWLRVRRRWLRDGRVLVQRRVWMFTREVDLPTARHVELRRHGGGVAQLVVRQEKRGRGITLELQAHTDYLDASRAPDQLDALGKAVAGAPATGAAEAGRVMKAQAAHLRDGGELHTAPLAAYVGRSALTGAAKAGGAAGGTSLFD